jgi:hypothetical protein
VHFDIAVLTALAWGVKIPLMRFPGCSFPALPSAALLWRDVSKLPCFFDSAGAAGATPRLQLTYSSKPRRLSSKPMSSQLSLYASRSSCVGRSIFVEFRLLEVWFLTFSLFDLWRRYATDTLQVGHPFEGNRNILGISVPSTSRRLAGDSKSPTSTKRSAISDFKISF